MMRLRRLTRSLLARPRFTIPAVLTLALGIGVNTAIFSLVQQVILKPLPYNRPERLVMIWGKMEKGAVTWVSGPEVRAYGEQTDTFAGVTAYDSVAMNLEGENPERVIVGAVTPNAFATLGVAPLVGRTFSSSMSANAQAGQIVLGYAIWQRRFGGRRDIVGRSIILNGKAWTVIGVMPNGFKLPLDFTDDNPSELWSPLDLTRRQSWGDHSWIAFARLRDGVSPGRASEAMLRLENQWIHDGNWVNFRSHRSAVPVKDLMLGGVRRALWLLFGAVGFILFIACANVANLMLASGDERSRELAVRTALGASRASIVRQLLGESLILAVTGGAVGLAVAAGGIRILLAMRPAGIPRLDTAGLDATALLFTLAVSVATVILFGLAPALAMARTNLNVSLKEGGRTGSESGARSRFRDGLAITQLALSVLLLIGAVLLTRTLIKLSATKLGFDTHDVLTFRVALPVSRYPDDQHVIDAVRAMRQRFADLPGVESAGAARLLPLSSTIGEWSITIEGRNAGPDDNPIADWQVATPGYLEAMRIPVLRGRSFTTNDNENAPLVAVVSRTTSGRYWPGQDAIGKRFRIGSEQPQWITIVGIIGEVRHDSVIEGPRSEMIVPHAQWAAAGASVRREMTFVLKTHGDPGLVAAQVRRIVKTMDPNLPISDVRTLDEVARDALAEQRFSATLFTLLAALALALAAIGIYGVISLLVSRHRREIGIRIALGASTSAILRGVLSKGMRLAAIGTLIGLGGSVLLTRLLTGLLYGVTPLDSATFLIAPAILAVVALVASLIPAGRAARLDPAIALRTE